MSYFDNYSRSDSKQERSENNNNRYDRNQDRENAQDEVFSVPVKAGKRIYYFDVKSTRSEDLYVTITESRKRQMRDGSFSIDKHKIHLYKEDFMKFAEGFEQVLAYVRENRPEFAEAEARGDFQEQHRGENESYKENFASKIPTEEEIFGEL